MAIRVEGSPWPPSTSARCSARASRVAAASALPPPSPAATGMRLWMSTWKPPGIPERFDSARTAAITRLSSPVGTWPVSSGMPSTVTDRVRSRVGRHRDEVVQAQREHHALQVVEPVLATAQDTQEHVDLRVRPAGDRLGAHAGTAEAIAANVSRSSSSARADRRHAASRPGSRRPPWPAGRDGEARCASSCVARRTRRRRRATGDAASTSTAGDGEPVEPHHHRGHRRLRPEHRGRHPADDVARAR